MADNDRVDLTPDSVAARLASGGDARQSVLMDGFVGDSGRDGVVRLFCSPDLSSFVDIPVEDVLHREQITSADDGTIGSRLWVHAGSQIERRTTTSEQLQARMLTGGVTSAMMTSAAASQPISSSFAFSPSVPPWKETINQHIPACQTSGIPGRGCGGTISFSPCNVTVAQHGTLCGSGDFVCGDTMSGKLPRCAPPS